MRFNYKKIAAAFTAVGLLGFTAGFVSAVSPSSQFEQGDTAIVYGSAAAQSDMVAATNIQIALGLEDEAGTPGAPTEGDFYQIEKAATKFNLGDGIAEVVSTTLDDSELSTILADEEFIDADNNNFDYTQELTLANLSLVHFEDSGYKQDVPTVGFQIDNGDFIMNYTLDFTDNPDWADLETSDIVIMGKTYYISDITTNTTIELLDSSSTTILNEGETETLSVGGKTYEVTINFIGSNDVKLQVNGEITNSLSEGQTYRLSDGSYVGIKDISVQDFQGGTRLVEFSIGNGKIELTHGQTVEMNEEDVQGLTAYLTSSGVQLSQIVIEWEADDDLFVTEDSTVTMPGTEAVMLSYTGLTVPEMEEFTVEKDGDTVLRLTDFPIQDSVVDIDLLYGNGTIYQGVGSAAGEGLQTTNGSILNYDSSDDSSRYFILTYDDGGTDAESYMVRLTDFTEEDSGATNTTTLQIMSDGTWTDEESDVEGGETIEIGSAELTVTSINVDADTAVLTAGSNTYFNRLYSAEGLKLILPHEYSSANYTLTGLSNNPGYLMTNTSADGYVNQASFQLQFTEEDENDNLGDGVQFNVTVGWESEEPSVTGIVGDSQQLEVEDSDNFESYIYSPLATMFLERTGGDQDTLDVTYHGSEVTANVFVSEVGTSSGGSVDSVVLMDSEVSGSAASRNWIVVGGSAVNTRAAQLLGVNYPAHGSEWESATGVGANSWLIRTFAHPTATDKVATLVAGYNAGDTTNAATYFTTQDVDITVGQQYVGQTGTAATSSVVSN
jgi:hypothetical protein